MTELGNIKCLPSITYLHIVSNMFSVTNSLRYSMALLACDHLIGEMTPGSIVTIAISTMSTMSIVMPIARVTVSCSFCFGRAERNIEDTKKNYNLTRKEKLKEKLR